MEVGKKFKNINSYGFEDCYGMDFLTIWANKDNHYLEIDEGLHCINTIPYKDKYGCWKVNGNHLFHSEFCESIFECDKLTVLQCVGTLKRNQN